MDCRGRTCRREDSTLGQQLRARGREGLSQPTHWNLGLSEQLREGGERPTQGPLPWAVMPKLEGEDGGVSQTQRGLFG